MACFTLAPKRSNSKRKHLWLAMAVHCVGPAAAVKMMIKGHQAVQRGQDVRPCEGHVGEQEIAKGVAFICKLTFSDLAMRYKCTPHVMPASAGKAKTSASVQGEK